MGANKGQKSQKKINTVQGLIRAIKQEWQSLSAEYARKLAESCTNRCRAIIDNKGDWTLY
jgi:flagellin-specific chaperone FliS